MPVTRSTTSLLRAAAELSFEDLPDQAIGIILRKLESPQDKVRLTQASPSARRLTRGPNCEPGVMGKLSVEFPSKRDVPKRSAARLSFEEDSGHIVLQVDPTHRDFPLALDYLAARSKAFAAISLETANSDLETHIRLLDALYRQGACSPFTLTFNGSVTSWSFRDYLDSAGALLSHWLTVSEGIHSPKDRSLSLYLYPILFAEDLNPLSDFLNNLKGMGTLYIEDVYSTEQVAFPQLPHLTDCLEKFSLFGPFLLDSAPCPTFTKLKDVTICTDRGLDDPHRDPRTFLRKFFELHADTLESVTMWATTGLGTSPFFTMDLLELLPKLKYLGLSPSVREQYRFPPIGHPYYQTNVCLPLLEELDLIFSIKIGNMPGLAPLSGLHFVSNLVLPRLQKLTIQSDAISDRPLKLDYLSRFSSLVEFRLLIVEVVEKAAHQETRRVLVSLGDWSDFTRLRTLSVSIEKEREAKPTKKGRQFQGNFAVKVDGDSSVLPPQMMRNNVQANTMEKVFGVEGGELVLRGNLCSTEV